MKPLPAKSPFKSLEDLDAYLALRKARQSIEVSKVVLRPSQPANPGIPDQLRNVPSGDLWYRNRVRHSLRREPMSRTAAIFWLCAFAAMAVFLWRTS